MQIEFIHWDKYNPRKDVKRPTWFRLENTLIENPDFYDFSDAEFKGLIYLLSLASKKDGKAFVLNFKHAKVVARLSEKILKDLIEKLKSLQMVHVHVTCTLRERDVGVTDTIATDGRTDERTDGEKLDPEGLAKAWNENSAKCQPKIRLRTFLPNTPRWHAANARLREVPEPEYWLEVIRKISESGFCRGENDRGWKADFEFLIRQETHIKAIEGKYDDHSKSASEDPDELIRKTLEAV